MFNRGTTLAQRAEESARPADDPPEGEDVAETVAVRLQDQGGHRVQSGPDAEDRRAGGYSATTRCESLPANVMSAKGATKEPQQL